MQISLTEAELRPNESPAKNTASYCIVLRHIVKVLDRSTPVFHLSKSNLPSLPDDTIPATLAHISAALSSRPIFSPYSFYPLHRPYICPACLCCTSDALPPRLPSFRRPASPRVTPVLARIPKRRLCQYLTPFPSTPRRPHSTTASRAIPSIAPRRLCIMFHCPVFPSYTANPRTTSVLLSLRFSNDSLRVSFASRPLRFMSSCRSRTASPPRGVSANIHSAYRKIFSTPLFLVSPSAQFSPSRAASHFFHRMNSVVSPLSPRRGVPFPLLTPGHPERRSILSLSYHFPALSCLFHNAVNTRFSHFVL